MLKSCGIIIYRVNDKKHPEFLLGHPGGNFWKDKDFWLFPKGCLSEKESIIDCAVRELKEETGIVLTDEEILNLIPLGSVQQNKKKEVFAFGLHKEGIEESKLFSNLVDGENFPEVESYKWFSFDGLKEKTHFKHISFFEKIEEIIDEQC